MLPLIVTLSSKMMGVFDFIAVNLSGGGRFAMLILTVKLKSLIVGV